MIHLLSGHGGRIVKHTGDGFLTEFLTASDAVRCACDMQTQMNARNIGDPAAKRFDFRMGINLGEIIVDEEDIYGDGSQYRCPTGKPGAGRVVFAYHLPFMIK